MFGFRNLRPDEGSIYDGDEDYIAPAYKCRECGAKIDERPLPDECPECGESTSAF